MFTSPSVPSRKASICSGESWPAIDGADIFTCAPGSLGNTTSCTYTFFWDGSAYGLSGKTLDGIEIGN